MIKEEIYIKEVFVNNRRNPAGIDQENLRFSWCYRHSERGEEQHFYRILVASNYEDICSGYGEVWDSKWVASKENSNLEYHGDKLKAGKRYWWRVYIRDLKENVGVSAEEAYFDMGIGQQDWRAKWIWKPGGKQINDFAYFRRAFQVERQPAEVKIYVSAHNHYRLFVNGIELGGYVSPAPSSPTTSKLYLTYDVSDNITAGKNTICAMAHYIGGDGQNYVNGEPGFILQAELTYPDGSRDVIITDTYWRCLENTPYKNGQPFQQNRRISAVESYDARLEPYEWMSTDFDDGAWSNAVLSEINTQNWLMKPQSIQEGYAEEIIIPEGCGRQKAKLQVFDAGKIITGWPRIKVSGERDTKIRMRYSEDITALGTVGRNVCNETSETYYDEYTLKGGGLEVWEPCFSYKAFRYIEVTGFTRLLHTEELEVVCAHTGLDLRGGFMCSSQLLEDLYNACIQTQKNNITGQMVDCPHREQAQYLADSDLQAETFAYNFYNPEVLDKVLSDYKDSQEQDGTFPFVYPSNYLCSEFHIKIPEWDLHYCTLLMKLYNFTGDIRVLENYYGTLKKMVGYYISCIDEKYGMIKKSEYWHISDWPYPNIDNQGRFLTVQNIKFYNVLFTMSSISGILDLEYEKEEYARKAEELGNSIVRHLYDNNRKGFVDSLGSSLVSQGTNVLALQYGLAPEEDRKKILDYIEGEGLKCSTLLSLNLLRVLFDEGRQESAYNLISREEFPGWGFMIKNGYRTIWEGFQNIESHCHAWNAYPARLLVEYVVGIKSLSPGFRKARIKPYIPEGLMFASGEVPTAKGNIKVKWERLEDSIQVAMSIPWGITALVILPLGNGVKEVRENNRRLWKEGTYYTVYKEITFKGCSAGEIEFLAAAGEYRFTLC